MINWLTDWLEDAIASKNSCNQCNCTQFKTVATNAMKQSKSGATCATAYSATAACSNHGPGSLGRPSFSKNWLFGFEWNVYVSPPREWSYCNTQRRRGNRTDWGGFWRHNNQFSLCRINLASISKSTCCRSIEQHNKAGGRNWR